MDFLVSAPATLATPSKLTRKNSNTYSQQWSEKTCSFHACSTTIARLFKVYFSQYFGEEIEWCDFYYDTRYCFNGNIFDCFKQDKDKNIRNCSSLSEIKPLPEVVLDKYGWNDENMSALLFHYIYSILSFLHKNKGIEKNGRYLIPAFFEDFKKKSITTTVVANILQYDSAATRFNGGEHWYFNKIITKLTDMLIDVKDKLENGTFSPNLYVACYLYGLLVVDPVEVYTYKTGSLESSKAIYNTLIAWAFKSTSKIKKFLKEVLNNGLYVIFAQSNHMIVLKGLSYGDNGKIYVSIKNSWGRIGRKWIKSSLWYKGENNNEIEFEDLFAFWMQKDKYTDWYFIYPNDLYNKYKIAAKKNTAKQFILDKKAAIKTSSARKYSGTTKLATTKFDAAEHDDSFLHTAGGKSKKSKKIKN